VVAKVEDPEIAGALIAEDAAHLSREGGALLKRRLEMGSCRDAERGRYNVGALRNLRFGHVERKSLSIGEGGMPGEVIAEHQKAYRRGATSWLPPGAIPGDPAERVRLYEERRAYALEQVGRAAQVGDVDRGPAADVGAAVDLSDDDLLGVGLASFPTLAKAAREIVRHVYRAAPRNWQGVEAGELRALDRYPDLVRVPIPAAPELTAPLGWVPGVGPSEAAEETFRKLAADWDGFSVAVPAVGAAEADAWRSFSEAWGKRTLLPGDVGDRLLAEVRRAQRVRAGLVRADVAEAASPAFSEVGRAEAEPEVEEGDGFRRFVSNFTSSRVLMAGGFVAALVASVLAPPRPMGELGEGGGGEGGGRPPSGGSEPDGAGSSSEDGQDFDPSTEEGT
jgi:hypothetical protein